MGDSGRASSTLKQRIGRFVFARVPVTRFLFDILRDEANGALVRVQNAVLPWRRRRLARLCVGRDLLVNVACGPQVLDGFVNLDLHPASP